MARCGWNDRAIIGGISYSLRDQILELRRGTTYLFDYILNFMSLTHCLLFFLKGVCSIVDNLLEAANISSFWRLIIAVI